MRIKPLRSMVGDYGKLPRGVIVDVPDHYAQQLIKRGTAVPVQGAAGTAPTRPLGTGGPTGAGTTSSSSVAGRAPGGPTSNRLGGKAAGR